MKDIFRQRTQEYKWLAAILGCVVLMYLRGLNGSFVLDDRTFFIDNDILPKLNPWDLKEIFLSPSNYWVDHLPFREFVFVIEHYFFGAWTAGYHVVSVVLYCLTGWVTYDLLLQLYRVFAPLQDRSSASVPSVFFPLAFFLLHPVHVEAVSYISSQKDLLYALFSLLAIDLTLRLCGQERPTMAKAVVAVLCYYIALLSKQAAISASLFVLFLWLFPLKKICSNNKKTFLIWLFVNVPAALWILYSMRISAATHNAVSAEIHDSFMFWLFRAVKIIGAHVILAVRPYPLSFGYPFDDSMRPDINLLAGVLFVVLMVLLLLLRRKSLLTTGMVLIFLFLFPVLQIIFSGYNLFVYDRYLFIPVLGFGIILERVLFSLPLRGRWGRKCRYAIMSVTVFALAALTFRHIPNFHDDIAMTRHTYKTYPRWSEGSFNYVYSLIEAGRLNEAWNITSNERTMESPAWVRNYFFGWIYLNRGDYSLAIDFLKLSSIEAHAGGYFPFADVPLGMALMKTGQFRQAKEALENVLRSQIRQPVDYYHAKRLIEEINKK